MERWRGMAPGLGSAALAVVALLIGGSLPARADPPPPPPHVTTYDMTARYRVDAHLDWKQATLHVDSTMKLENTSGETVDRLQLNALPAAFGVMTLDEVRVGGTLAAATIKGQTLIVPLDPALDPGASATVRVVYDAPLLHTDANHAWMFAKLQGEVMAYRWIPWLSRIIPFKGHVHGDPFVTPTSPRVRVTITSDRPLRYATTGVRLADEGLSQTFLAKNVRDFNFTAAPDFHITSGLSGDGQTTISVFTRWGHGPSMLAAAKRAFDAYENEVGPYPYTEFDLSQTPAGTGQESPGLVWIPYTTGLRDFLIAHETAHQWFYSTVGNDQVTDPFADEAVAEFLSRRLAYHLRPSYCPKARLDLGLYDYSVSCYYEVIYEQGANFLDRLRRDMGNAAFWHALRTYYADQRFAVSSNRRLLQAFHAVAGDWVLPRFQARFPSLF